MGILCVAITHQTLSEGDELVLLAEKRVAIGTAIGETAESELGGNAKKDVELLSRLGVEGGIAVVTYGKGNQRWLCRFAPARPVEMWGKLRSLRFSDMLPLPPSLQRINTLGCTIRALSEQEATQVLDTATSLRLHC